MAEDASAYLLRSEMATVSSWLRTQYCLASHLFRPSPVVIPALTVNYKHPSYLLRTNFLATSINQAPRPQQITEKSEFLVFWRSKSFLKVDTLLGIVRMSKIGSDTELARTSTRIPESKELATSLTAGVESLDAPEFDQTATKRLLRKIDFKIIPFLSLIYL